MRIGGGAVLAALVLAAGLMAGLEPAAIEALFLTTFHEALSDTQEVNP